MMCHSRVVVTSKQLTLFPLSRQKYGGQSRERDAIIAGAERPKAHSHAGAWEQEQNNTLRLKYKEISVIDFRGRFAYY